MDIDVLIYILINVGMHTMAKPVYTENTWDYDRFASLWDLNPKEALAYRERCLAKKDEALEDATTTTTVAEATTAINKIELGSAEAIEEAQKDELKKLLDEKGVKYHRLAGLSKLMTLAVENGIIEAPKEAKIDLPQTPQVPQIESSEDDANLSTEQLPITNTPTAIEQTIVQ